MRRALTVHRETQGGWTATAIWLVFQRKLDQFDPVTGIDDLRIPPGNRLHRLVDELAGFHAIRVNDQHRIIFRFEGEPAFDVRCADYH